MNRRLYAVIVVVGLMLIPVSALADTSGGTQLGPTTTTPGSGGSSADGTALQPAGASTLQPGGDVSTYNGLTSSNTAGNSLQQPSSTDSGQLQVLLGGEADGPSHSPATGTSWVWYLVSAVIVVVLAGGSIYGVEHWSNRRI